MKAKYVRERDAKPTHGIEIKGFIGILLMAGVLKISRSSTSQIFEHVKHTGVDAIYLTMSEQRFKFLLRNLRFDDIRDREDRAKIDKLHPPCTLVSYKANPNKVVILMSTMHNDAAIEADTGDKQKPEIISYYNRTKNGVDLIDKMCSLYDVSRNSRRWPVTVFYDLINLSALNALCIHSANKNFEFVRRRDFLIKLALAWMKPLAQQRLDKKTLPRSLSLKIKDFLGLPQQEIQPSTPGPIRRNYVGRCHDCGRTRNRSTRKMCNTCRKFICPDHSKIVCLSCSQNSS